MARGRGPALSFELPVFATICEVCKVSKRQARLFFIEEPIYQLLYHLFGNPAEFIRRYYRSVLCEKCVQAKIEEGLHYTCERCGMASWSVICQPCIRKTQEAWDRAELTAVSAERRARTYRQMPVWADRTAIKLLYVEAQRISRATGIKHHVDHYYPLNSPLVSGLHVADNLRIIPACENLKKGNRMPQR